MLAGRALCRQQGPRPTTTITYNAWCTTHALQPTSCRVLHLRGHRKGFRVERWELGTVSGLPCLVSDVWVNQVVPQPQLGPNTPSDQPCKDNNRHKDMIARWLAALLPRPRLHRTVQDDEDRTVARASVLQARMLVHWPDRGGGAAGTVVIRPGGAVTLVTPACNFTRSSPPSHHQPMGLRAAERWLVHSRGGVRHFVPCTCIDHRSN